MFKCLPAQGLRLARLPLRGFFDRDRADEKRRPTSRARAYQ
jgi:hypothetical protein